MLLSCSAKKVTKECGIGEALSCLLPQAKTPSPMYLSRRALTMALEHLNLPPVRTKNVPIFCPKGDISETCYFCVRTFEEEPAKRWVGYIGEGGAPRSESKIS